MTLDISSTAVCLLVRLLHRFKTFVILVPFIYFVLNTKGITLFVIEVYGPLFY